MTQRCFFTSFFFIYKMVLCTSNPMNHPFITEKEKEYLKKEIGQLERSKKQAPTPWKAILTSGPVIALVLIEVRCYCYYLKIIEI